MTSSIYLLKKETTSRISLCLFKKWMRIKEFPFIRLRSWWYVENKYTTNWLSSLCFHMREIPKIVQISFLYRWHLEDFGEINFSFKKRELWGRDKLTFNALFTQFEIIMCKKHTIKSDHVSTQQTSFNFRHKLKINSLKKDEKLLCTHTHFFDIYADTYRDSEERYKVKRDRIFCDLFGNVRE